MKMTDIEKLAQEALDAACLSIQDRAFRETGSELGVFINHIPMSRSPIDHT